MGLEENTRRICERVGDNSGLDATIKFVVDSGVIRVDTKVSPHTVTNRDAPAQCTVTLSDETLTRLLDGSQNPTAAYAAGELAISGDTSIALKLGRLFRPPS